MKVLLKCAQFFILWCHFFFGVAIRYTFQPNEYISSVYHRPVPDVLLDNLLYMANYLPRYLVL
jgi:hypothetical protein